MDLEKAFKQIFPNGNIKHFLHLWKWNKDFKDLKERMDFCLWGYGEIRNYEYKKEKQLLLKFYYNYVPLIKSKIPFPLKRDFKKNKII